MVETARTAHLRVRAAIASAALMVAILFQASPSQAAQCTDYAIEAEREHDLPPGLLLSIALVESGMGGVPQPYALNVGGRPVMAASREEARAHLRDPAGRLRKNVMVGCMQISLTYHKEHFKPVDRILDPRANVFYAARYLKRLRIETGSWTKAVARYQGGSQRQRLAYVCKVHGNLSALAAEGASILDAAHCPDGTAPGIAPETRQKFRNRQIASADHMY
ncbi:transglycosylase SLT domain-containing protein [Arenibaculum sp.]|jgi:hypothetical protein|uniref:transglycosylase SLT domain-containing protein n=1 Tax=Arenibaculum sp. TaxID=2865862 RepID=UPI002E0D1047|nr:transglycosylase SLT domain-containing protein [Arenibaculum sp.]